MTDSRTVLGVDAAWTLTGSSGLAVVKGSDRDWRLIAASDSFVSFCTPTLAAPATTFSANLIIRAAETLADSPISLVAVDMPLSHSPITGRRQSDNAVSTAYGSRKCGTHSPSANRPGPISDNLRLGLLDLGYALQTVAVRVPGLIEVYPHPALVELMRSNERLPYKASKIGSYWRTSNKEERRRLLFQQWSKILEALSKEIAGVQDVLTLPSAISSIRELKSFEDKLDAIVCAWVGIQYLQGQAVPYGNEQSAIWIPVRR
jgi:predicted RNase H-like nuclease